MSKTLTLLRYVAPRRGCVRGPHLAEYERAFAGYIGAVDAVGFWKGRVAFYAALRAAGLGPGDEIIMPAYTCMVIPAAAMMLGVKCVYVDIEPTYCTLDADRLAGAVTPRTKALMLQHTYGWPQAGLERIVGFAKAHNLFIIEDCCHTLGTRIAGRHMGTFGDAAFFSSQWSKPYTTGLGGMLAINNEEFAKRVRELREARASLPSARTAAQLAAQALAFHFVVYPSTMTAARRGYRWASRRFITGSTDPAEYTTPPADYFKSMSEVQAAAGLESLARVDSDIRHRREISALYDSALQAAGWNTVRAPQGADVTLVRYPVRVAEKPAALAAAERHYIELGDWFNRPLHSHLAAQEAFGYQTGMCSNADKAALETINLPTHPRVSRRYAERAVRFLIKHCRPAEGVSD